MTTTAIPTYPIAIQDVVGSRCDGCSVLSLVLFFCSYYVAPERNFKGNAWERICSGQLLLDKKFIKKKFLQIPLCPLHGLHQ